MEEGRVPGAKGVPGLWSNPPGIDPDAKSASDPIRVGKFRTHAVA